MKAPLNYVNIVRKLLRNPARAPEREAIAHTVWPAKIKIKTKRKKNHVFRKKTQKGRIPKEGRKNEKAQKLCLSQ